MWQTLKLVMNMLIMCNLVTTTTGITAWTDQQQRSGRKGLLSNPNVKKLVSAGKLYYISYSVFYKNGVVFHNLLSQFLLIVCKRWVQLLILLNLFITERAALLGAGAAAALALGIGALFASNRFKWSSSFEIIKNSRIYFNDLWQCKEKVSFGSFQL